MAGPMRGIRLCLSMASWNGVLAPSTRLLVTPVKALDVVRLLATVAAAAAAAAAAVAAAFEAFRRDLDACGFM